ncbi:unnamed protein product [Closterium sp. Naga37s-1]|nr:unnamed protein product [Closterium sp. Naga37s-1]
MALGRLSVEEQFEAQCDAHGRSATRMGAVRLPWAQCDAHGRSATRMGAVRRTWARSDFSNLPSPLSPAHVQIVDARAARSPTTSPPLWAILRAAHAVAQPRHLPSDTLPRHLPSDALPRLQSANAFVTSIRSCRLRLAASDTLNAKSTPWPSA